MRAFHVVARGIGAVVDTDEPVARAGEVIVRTTRAGICGTDTGLFVADDARLLAARTDFPLRLGHEWSGVVVAVGSDGDAGWLGARVTGDTMIGCGVCDRCRAGRHHLCADRYEIGVRRGRPGAFAELLPVPVANLRRLPDAVTDEMGAMVEPGGNALRAVDAALADGGRRVLIVGPGTVGLLSALFARAHGARVGVLGITQESVRLASGLGLDATSDQDAVRDGAWEAVIDATDHPAAPGLALDLVEPGGRVVLMGVAHEPSLVDTRTALRKEATIAGVLGGSSALDRVIEHYADGDVDPRPLIAETIRLEDLADELGRRRGRPADGRPKVLLDPLR